MNRQEFNDAMVVAVKAGQEAALREATPLSPARVLVPEGATEYEAAILGASRERSCGCERRR